MSRINQELVEFSFSPKHSHSLELNMLLGADSVYYCLTDPQLNVSVLKTYHFDLPPHRSLTENIKLVFVEDPLLKEHFRTTKIVLTTPHFTLVPDKFFNEKEIHTYLKNLTDITENDTIMADSLKNQTFKNIYSVNKPLLQFVQSMFPNARIYHSATALIEGYRKIAELKQGHQVFANVRDGQVQILFFDSQNLIFVNSYPFQTSQDLIYYIMLVYDQFKLSPETIPLSISGSLTESSDIFKLIYRYIRLVSFAKAPDYFHFGHQFTGVPQHFYFDLLSTKLLSE